MAVATNSLTGGDRWGFDADANLAGDFSVSGTLGVRDPDDEGIESTTYAGVGAAFFAGRIQDALGGRTLTACPTVSMSFADVGDTEIYSIPVGFGVGTSMSLGDGNNELHPYVLPSIVFAHAGDEDETESDFQLSLGANATLGNGFYVGGAVNRVFVEGADSEFGVRAGFVF